MTVTAKGTILDKDQRSLLDKAVQNARAISETAATDVLRALAVEQTHKPGYLTDEQNTLRLALRDKARQLGDDTRPNDADLTQLAREVAYVQWHRLLFARFLIENGLMRHPEYRDLPLTLDDCGEFAAELDEPDAWSVAARFASAILPGVFRLDDPAFQVRFNAEHRLELEALLNGLPAAVFRAEDALGWVYQFWQTAEKKKVNDSGRKIGGADLSPVTQLFTENYMVRFLLENSLGAWWAARHPDSPLVKEWEYLRRLDDGTPAAGTFDEWPPTAAEVTVMDPCCGSGHFLVAMFGMLWRMRAEEEGLAPDEAQDAVLRDNLFGLELDPRCTQIATFNVALEAWKQGGFRNLPAPQIACSGIPVRGTQGEWEALAGDDSELRAVMVRLHTLFRNADTLGSLIDPRPADGTDRSEGMFGRDLSIGVDWGNLRALLDEALRSEHHEHTVLGSAAEDVMQAAGLLGGRYTLVATNPPFLQRQSMAPALLHYVDMRHARARGDLATAFVERALGMAEAGGDVALVSPQNWQLLKTYTDLRTHLLDRYSFEMVARLGSGAFRQITGEVVKVSLLIIGARHPSFSCAISSLMGHRIAGVTAKSEYLRYGNVECVAQSDQRRNPDARITLTIIDPATLLARRASGLNGTTTGDYARYGRVFWEVSCLDGWEFQQSTVRDTVSYGGREHMILWADGDGPLQHDAGATIRGKAALGRRGVAVSQMGDLPVTLFDGQHFDNNTAVILPRAEADLPAIWAYCSSPEFNRDVREIDDALKVTNATLVKVAFDHERWQKVADEAGPLPEPHSDDPTQWLFKGDVATSTGPLQVAVARLLGYRWPDQEPGNLDRFADNDGIVALPALPGGEGDATTRLRALLAAAYGDEWSATLERRLVTEAGGKSGRLGDWLRETFFANHCKVFDNRPFLWHIWDGRKDGFSAIVNYHRLDRPTLEKLTYTTLGAWIERQRHEVAEGRAGADTRLAAAETLQGKLTLILKGAPPYDVYVRWKEMHEQPIGWEPDLDDGVRLNIRPFIKAGVLRIKLDTKIKWNKDRGLNPDGTERLNDLHPTLEERRDARRRHAAGSGS